MSDTQIYHDASLGQAMAQEPSPPSHTGRDLSQTEAWFRDTLFKLLGWSSALIVLLVGWTLGNEKEVFSFDNCATSWRNHSCQRATEIFMKKLGAAILFAALLQGCAATSHLNCAPATAAADITLISDVDDTVKVTNVMSAFAKLKNGLSGRLMFAGMPDLYKELLTGKAPGRLEFVSAAPKLLRRRVNRGLSDAGFDRFQLALRTSLTEAPDRFKLECLGEMHGKEDSAGKFYLIGDDTEKDPEVYAEFRAKHQDEVIATYIHRIAGRGFDYKKYGMVTFTTAYDIALNEYKERRLSPEQAEVVGEAVLTSPDSAFFPAFQKCPEGSTPRGNLPDHLKVIDQLIEKRIRNLCSETARAGTTRPHPIWTRPGAAAAAKASSSFSVTRDQRLQVLLQRSRRRRVTVSCATQ